jgi:hypothetical protein
MSGCQSSGEVTTDNNEVGVDIPEYTQASEDIVDTHGNITNLNRFFAFSENVQKGNEDKIRVVRYTTEGDPMIHDLAYDGKIIKSTSDTRRDKFGSGNLNTNICKSIEVVETKERTDYTLSNCEEVNIDNFILTIEKST